MNKWTQRETQQTPKQIKGYCIKKEIYELRKTTQNIKEELNRDKKESNRNPGI
jgi:hypothetical protein